MTDPRRTPRRIACLAAALACGTAVAVVAQPGPAVRVERVLDAPIIGPDLHPSVGVNIQGPSLIRVPEWVDDPLGAFYLYFADHKGHYIRLAYADEAGIRCCVVHGGSYEPEGWGTPNPDNQSERAFEDTVTAVQAILDGVQPTQAKLTLEPERWLLPDEPEVYLRLLEAIDRPGFGVHLDPVNIIASPKTFYDSGALLKECFGTLGPHILSCHTKDVVTVDRYPYHLIETYTGNGMLDHDVYLAELDRLDADVSLMIEHLTAEQLPKARDFLFERTEELGLAFVMPVK